MSNLTVNGTNLDSLFDPLGGLTKRADVNIRSGGSDISNRFAAAADGTAYGGTTNFRSGGSDIGPLFAEIGTALYPGAVWTWGGNSYGELGNNTRTNTSSPIQTVAGGTNWKQVAGGLSFTAAVKTDGTLWTWGRNLYGTLGNNTTINTSSPIQTVAGGTNWKQVTCGVYHVAAIKTDGTLWTWGSNSYRSSGNLGDNTTINRSSPVQTVAGGTNWKQVAGALYHSAGIKTDGTLWTWGRNSYTIFYLNFSGLLGDNTAINRSSPVQTVAGGTNWKLVSCSNYHTTAIKTDGTLWTWGTNSYGSLGDNTTINRSSPVQTVAGGTNWKQVASGIRYTTAIKTDGTLWTWGRNDFGQLGDNTIIHRSSPVQTVAAGTNWKLVSCGRYTIATIKTDGRLWMWGNGANGELGDNTTIMRSSPIQTVAGGTNWKQVAGALYYSAGIR